MQGIKIVATGRALPQRIVTNEELSRQVDTTDEWIRTRTGIGQRYICEEETCTSLAIRAAEKAMEKAGIGKEQVEAIVVATATSD
ncbi:MAG: 3-oxoacyl-ACP synthase, partial [Lachnospiraceae bacterium]